MTKQVFIAYIEDVVKRTQKFPKVEDLAIHFGIPQYKISGLLKQLHHADILVRVNNWYRLPSQMPNFVPKENVPNVPDDLDENEREEPLKQFTMPMFNIRTQKRDSVQIIDKPVSVKKTDFSLDILSWVLFVMGIGASIASAYYSQIYLASANKPEAAWFLSILMVTFSAIVFILIALMISKKVMVSRWRYILVIIFSILWLITTAYSIAATVAGQYNQRTAYMEVKVETDNKNIIAEGAIALEKESREDLIETRNDLRKRLDGLNEASGIALKTPELIKESWTSIQSRIVATQDSIAKLNDKIEKTRVNETELIKNNPLAKQEVKKQMNFAQWIAGLFNGNEETIQFWMTLFPAVFLDIIAPVFLTLFVFIRKRQ